MQLLLADSRKQVFRKLHHKETTYARFQEQYQLKAVVCKKKKKKQHLKKGVFPTVYKMEKPGFKYAATTVINIANMSTVHIKRESSQ